MKRVTETYGIERFGEKERDQLQDINTEVKPIQYRVPTKPTLCPKNGFLWQIDPLDPKTELKA